MKNILVVDDNEQNLYMLAILLKTNGYQVNQALNGDEALITARQSPPDMVISDILMPVMDGFSLCRNWMADERLKMIPFIFYTATYTDPKDEAFALSLGATRFLIKPTAPLEFLGVVDEVFKAFEPAKPNGSAVSEGEGKEYYKEYSEVLIRKLEDKMMQLEQINSELVSAYDTTLEGWSRALDLRDKETEGHTQRVVNLALRLARAMGIDDNRLIHLRRGAILHDIGKLGIPDNILLKPGPLSPEEWNVMRRHPIYAYEWLKPIAYLQPALDIPYCHHEKWDGSGYPRGLKGEEIPLLARIFAHADVYDAFISDRSYRKAVSSQQALRYISDESGKHFDPRMADIFLSLFKTGGLR